MTERREFSRRSFLRGGILLSSFAASPFVMREAEPKDIDIGQFAIDVIAHNAAINPPTFESAIASHAPHIEVDLTLADGELVVAHSPDEFFRQSQKFRANQDPETILNRIIDSGHTPFLDLKDEIKQFSDIQSFLRKINQIDTAMASSNNHELLLQIKHAGFAGKILFSIGTEEALNKFLGQPQEFTPGAFGVSIRHTLLQYRGIPGELKRRGLSIAAWNPTFSGDVARACMNGANFITTDNFRSLSKRVYAA